MTANEDSQDDEQRGSAIAASVDRALAAIRADAPDYAEALRDLLPESLRLAQRAHEPAMAELFAELRKLRPISLWVRDRVAPALAAKGTLQLDGALCAVADDEAVPPPAGRECWIELDASGAEARVAALPGGYGLVLRGPVHDLTLAAIRRRAPLRALGVVCRAVEDLPDARLDLVLIERDARGAIHGAPAGARILCSGMAPESVRLVERERGLGGLVCDAAHACAWALRLAAHRPMRAV